MAIDINIPSQVRTFANLAAFPATGALKTIYIAEDTNKTYRWTGSVYVEVSASASGITIGTTAIASGTVGRVLFEGTGNVVSQSANLFWDATNNRLGIGTETPAHTFQVYRNTSAGYLASFNSGATLNTNASLTVRIENANLPSVQGLSAGAGGFNTIAINPLGGNVLINTITDAGFRLDVNGTARVSGDISTNTVGTGFKGTISGSIRSWLYNATNGGQLYLYRTGSAVETLFLNGSSAGDSFINTGGGLVINSSTLLPSAQLQADSTTRGFLPPRMTTTQKNAIASPAAGLQIFDTTLNRPCFYDGTTWITL